MHTCGAFHVSITDLITADTSGYWQMRKWGVRRCVFGVDICGEGIGGCGVADIGLTPDRLPDSLYHSIWKSAAAHLLATRK